MKTLFVLLFSLSIGLVFSQEKMAVIENMAAVKTLNEQGKITLTLPKDVTAEQVNQSKKYYELYFDVNFDASKNQAQIIMKQNDFRGRSVIKRFVRSFGVEHFKVGDKVVDFNAFDELIQ